MSGQARAGGSAGTESTTTNGAVGMPACWKQALGQVLVLRQQQRLAGAASEGHVQPVEQAGEIHLGDVVVGGALEEVEDGVGHPFLDGGDQHGRVAVDAQLADLVALFAQDRLATAAAFSRTSTSEYESR